MRKTMGLLVITAGLLFSSLAHGAATTKTWTGSVIDNNWSTGANWGGTAPSAGDALVFPSGSSFTSPNNDFGPTPFDSISIDHATGYTITGNSVTLSGTGVNLAAGTIISSTSGANTLSIGITLSTASAIVCSGGSLTLSGAIGNGGFDISFDSTAPITVSGVISGGGGIDESGSGGAPALTLSGANIYGGTTTINSMGTLIAANNTALGAAGNGTTVIFGGTLILATGVTISGEALTLNGMGVGGTVGALVNGTGSNTWSGNISLGSPANIAGGGGGLLTLSNPGTLSLGVLNDLTFAGSGLVMVNQVISGSGKVKVAGDTVTLNAASTYTGATSVGIGTLIAGGDVVANANGPFGNSAGAVQVGSIFNATLEVSGSMFTRDISVIGSGTPLIVVDSASNISGAITNTGSSPLGIATNGITGFVSGSINNGGQPLSLLPGPAQTLQISGAITGAGPLSCDGPGTLVLTSASNSFGGLVAINLGTLRVGSAAAIPVTADVSVTGTLDLNNFSVTVASITGAGGISLGTGTLTVAPTGPDTFNGVISGGAGGGLTLSSGTLTLTAANTYNGPTMVNGGVLTVDGFQVFSPVAVKTGAALQGFGSTGNVTVTGGGIGVGDPSGAVATLNTGGVTLDAASLVKLNVAGFVPGISADLLNIGGVFNAAGTLNLDLAGLAAPGTATVMNYSSLSGAFNAVTLSNNANNYGATLNPKPTALDVIFTAPIPAPTLAAASDSGTVGDGITNVNKPTINGIGAGAGATINIFDAANNIGNTLADGAGNWTFTCPATLADGPHALAATQTPYGGLSAPLLLIVDTSAPTVTITQQTGQPDPAIVPPVQFVVTFSEPVMGFATTDVQLSGTAGATTATVTSVSPTQFEVDVTGMTAVGTVSIDIAAGVATDPAGNASLAATLTDNTVNFSPVPQPPVIDDLGADSDEVGAGETINFDADATSSNGTLTYAWDFGDGAKATGNPVSHVFTATVDQTMYTVTLKVTDAAGLSASDQLPITVDVPESGAITDDDSFDPSTKNVTSPDGTGVSDKSTLPGIHQFDIGISPSCTATTLCEGTVNIFGIVNTAQTLASTGRATPTVSATLHGLHPRHKFRTAGVNVAFVQVLQSNQVVGIARKTIAISSLEVGSTASFSDSAKNRSITSTKINGSFNFNRSGAAATAVKPDKVTFSGTFEMPKGVDLSQTQEFQVGIGNVIDSVRVNNKGKSMASGALKNVQKVQISYPRLPKGQKTTAAGAKAKFSLTMNSTGLSAAGFESDGISNKLQASEQGKKSVPRMLQVAMSFSGETYQIVAPVQYKLSTKGTSGSMSGRSGQ